MTYRVARAVSTADKDGNVIHLTRENETQVEKLLSKGRLTELVEAGVIVDDEVEAEEPTQLPADKPKKRRGGRPRKS